MKKEVSFEGANALSVKEIEAMGVKYVFFNSWC